MDGYPPISAMCLTYGRPRLLEEAIHSFLLQDYPGPKELVVLNDFAKQTLLFDHPEVRIINTAARFRTVGEKRNACAALASHDILFVWDDDDLYLPWRLSLSIRRLNLAQGFYKPARAWILRQDTLEGPDRNLFHSGACFTRRLFDQVQGYPHCGSGQDWGIEQAFEKVIGRRNDDQTLPDHELYYLYRWEGTGSYHLSAFGRDDGQSLTGGMKVADFIEQQVRAGIVATGQILVYPSWRRDYVDLVRRRCKPPVRSEECPDPRMHFQDSASSQSKLVKDPPMALPLVSCIMPTYGRADYVAESVAMFLAQDYPAKELIILNDCPGQTLSGDFPGVRIVNAPERWTTLGEKRNAAIEFATGEFIAVWDDDDVYLPWRLSFSLERIQALKASIYCPAEYWAYWGDEHLHDNQAQLDWIYHPLVIFRRDLWEAVGGYPAQTAGEDTVFFRKALQLLGIEWPRDEIAAADRVMILRGKSKYAHTSIPGGVEPPHTAPGAIALAPRSVQDPILASVAERLIRFREAERLRRHISLDASHKWPGVPSDAPRRFLDELTPTLASVAHGNLGQFGDLGYEGKRVRVCGELRHHALSAHAPSRLVYQLNGRYSHLCCQVAMNDDVPPDASAADFLVRADNRLVVIARNVRPGHVPRMLVADLRGAQEMELLVRHHQWEHCHSVWIDPILISSDPSQSHTLISALDRADIVVPPSRPPVELCLATVGSPGYEDWIDDLLGSVCANAQCADALLAIFFLGESERIRQVAEKYGALVISCQPRRPLSVACKSVLYSIGRVIDAAKFICLDADILVLDDLRPITAALDAVSPGSILVCREACVCKNLGQAIGMLYDAPTEEATALLASDAAFALASSLVVNDGIFAGTGAALCGIDDFIRGMNNPADWVDNPDINRPWRNQFVFNLALAQTRTGMELDSRYNVQLHFESIQFREQAGFIAAESDHRRAALVHFGGDGKHREAEWRGRFRRVERPLVPNGESNAYRDFLTALRKWVGRYGLDALAWSFYGTPDALHARVRHPATFPLFAALHNLIRANGCHRVIETGTARGVSAACLASAVAHYPDAQVVTFDIRVFSEREILWSALPDAIRRTIVPRQVDVLAGLQAALDRGETYQAALLDSLHTAEHVLQEFALATQLVCPGGLILIHDAILNTGTVGKALDQIADQGYGVVRLWTAEEGTREDAGLGLALIENRRKPR